MILAEENLDALETKMNDLNKKNGKVSKMICKRPARGERQGAKRQNEVAQTVSRKKQSKTKFIEKVTFFGYNFDCILRYH